MEFAYIHIQTSSHKKYTRFFYIVLFYTNLIFYNGCISFRLRSDL